MSTVKVNKLEQRSGCTATIGGGAGKTVVVDATTVTLGRCGATISLASGASQSGFGSTGGISWQTSIKTGDFAAVSNEGYFVDTSSGTITVTLPSSPSAGNVVAIKDYARNFGNNKVTLARNGSNMDGAASDTDLDVSGLSVTVVFMDSTKGWSLINDDTTSRIGATFVAATGGNATLTNGNFKTHIFTSPGTFCVSAVGNPAGSDKVDYVVVAGGGGGAKGTGPDGGGGAGAGGMRLSNSAGCVPAPTMSPLVAPTNLPVSVQGYPITVGGGGAGHTPCGPGGPTGPGAKGNDSVFSTITSTGGGFGGKGSEGGPGGSGGGAHQNTQGTGNSPSVSPPQGNPGSGSGPPFPPPGGGGGGAGFAAIQSSGSGGPPRGGTFNPSQGGDGGDGSFVADTVFGPTAPSYGTPGATSSTRYFAGGGGGGPSPSRGGQSTSNGGQGGGANGVASTKTPGTVNTGGGGAGNEAFGGGNGGSGIVIIRYKFQ
jgi:hypothetical protein